MNTPFSLKLQRLRAQKGVSREALAAALLTSVGAVYLWETGKAIPRLDNAARIAAFFNVSVDWLAEGMDIEETPPN